MLLLLLNIEQIKLDCGMCHVYVACFKMWKYTKDNTRQFLHVFKCLIVSNSLKPNVNQFITI